MCGICGIVGSDGAIAEKRIRRMMNALVHRGPDAEGTLSRPGVSFGARRLNIIDAAGGHQPIYNETADVGVVFNGEIYNFRQLRGELESLGHRFHSRSDTEVIAHAYEEWGERCVEHLHGMFALAIWDGRNAAKTSGKPGRVFLARDRLGIKPLYYAMSAGSLFFASEVRALLASEALERRLSRQAVEGYLLFGSIVEPCTLFEGVYSLPPGHSLTLELDAPICVRPSPYWDLPLSVDRIRKSSQRPEPPARELRALLENVLREHLFADVPVGVFLSGGLDSTALAALAAQQWKDVHTFTLCFRERQFDEAAEARNTARHLGTRHHELLLTEEEMHSRLLEAVAALDQPSMDGVNTYFVSWAARQAGLKVALSGLGGDELFGGYPTFRTTPYLAKVLALARRLPEAAGQATAHALHKLSRVGGNISRADGLRKIASIFSRPNDLPHAYFFARMLFTPGQTERLLLPTIMDTYRQHAPADNLSWRESLAHLADCANAFERQSTVSYLELRHYTLNTLLRDTDSMSMYHGLEIRVPLLDDQVVEFLHCLPDRARYKARNPKALLAEAVKDLLPVELLDRPKRTFTLPWEQWFRGPLGAQVASRLNTLTPSLAAILDPKMVQSVWRGFLRKRTGWARPWSLFVLNEWVRTYADEAFPGGQVSEDAAAQAAAG